MLVFASTVPLVGFAGVLFFCMRHVVDSYNLLTNNRKEIDSSSKVFQKILLHIQFAILLLQLCMIAYMATNAYRSCACFLGVVLAITLLLVALTNKSLFDINKQDQTIFNDAEEPVPLEEELGGHQDDLHGCNSQCSVLYAPLMKWRQEYSHPLMIGSSRAEEVASTKGDPEPKNMKEVDRDQLLREMIFAGAASEGQTSTDYNSEHKQ